MAALHLLRAAAVAWPGALAADLQQLAALRCSGLWQGQWSHEPRRRFATTSSSGSAAAAAVVTATAAPKAAAAQGAPPLAAADAQATGSSRPKHQQGSDTLLSTLLHDGASKDLDVSHIGLYYQFDKSLVPEAFRPFHQAFYSPRPAKLQRKGGCRGLQGELAASGSSRLMWRRSSQELAAALEAAAPPRVHLRGPAGSGKSVALVQLVERARSAGWLVLYVPSAAALTRGGFFYRRPEDDTYDTIISAQHVLKSVADSHGGELAGMPLALDESRGLLGSPAAAEALGGAGASAGAGRGGAATLGDLLRAGLCTDDDGRLAVESCLLLVRELAAASAERPVLLAVDDYNSLHWRSEYGTTVTRRARGQPPFTRRVEVPVGRLNLARGFRLLERSDLQRCRVLVADSASRGVPADLEVPNGTGAPAYHMPRFSPVETAHALHYYHERGLAPAPPTEQQVAALRALTNGNGAELRRWCVKATQTGMGAL